MKRRALNAMSVTRAIRDAGGLTAIEKYLLQAILLRQNWQTGGPCHASNATLAADAGMSVRAVRINVLGLVDRGLVSRIGTKGGNRTNRLRLQVTAIERLGRDQTPARRAAPTPAPNDALDTTAPGAAPPAPRADTPAPNAGTPAPNAADPGLVNRACHPGPISGRGEERPASTKSTETTRGLRFPPDGLAEGAHAGRATDHDRLSLSCPKVPIGRARWSSAELTPILEAYPPAQRVGRMKALVAIGEALGVIDGRGETEPVAWLLTRVRAFAASPKGRSRFVKQAAAWFADGHYDDPPEAWQDAGEANGRERKYRTRGFAEPDTPLPIIAPLAARTGPPTHGGYSYGRLPPR